MWYKQEDAVKLVKEGHSSLVEFKWYNPLIDLEVVDGYEKIEGQYDRFPICRLVTQEEWDEHQKNYIDIDDPKYPDDMWLQPVYRFSEDGTIIKKYLKDGEKDIHFFDIKSLIKYWRRNERQEIHSEGYKEARSSS